jgi:conjugative transfer signal peptidase TraF
MTTTGLFNSGRASRQSIGRLFAVAAVVLIGSFEICDVLGLRINVSPSLPLGLYVVANDSRGQLVEFCPPEPFATLAAARGYRHAGSCPDGAAPLLKPVAARPGDSVELTSAGISVNGHLLPRTAPLIRDTRGRMLSPWPLGNYIVAPGTVWVASTFNPRSFDSRYFGPIDVDSIRNRVRLLVTAW